MITFRKILPAAIDKLPVRAVNYLDEAIRYTPASTSRLDVTLDIAKRGYGNIYLIYDDGRLTGASYLVVYDTPQGKVVAPVLLGGDNMQRWQDDWYHFVFQFSSRIAATKVKWIGRKGWHRAFPKSRVIGYVMEHDVEPLEGVQDL